MYDRENHRGRVAARCTKSLAELNNPLARCASATAASLCAMGLRPAPRQLVLAALVAVVLVGGFWYLRPAGATWLIVSLVFVGLVLVLPLFTFHGRFSGEVQRI